MSLLNKDSKSLSLKGLQEKWADIIRDYEANVTNIYGREIMHQLFDVVMHSALSFNFKGSLVQRGWVEALIVSDTRCGKSQTANSLCKHYRISPPVNCERASMPGVLGGILQEGGGRSSVIWGAIPRQDQRAVVLEELTGLSQDDISQMSDCRSSGIASIVKIINERTMARTRKLMNSNPRTDKNRKMNTYMQGVLTVPEIVGRAEDIARFDIATAANAEEVGEEVLNAYTREAVPHKYTSEAAHTLLFWCWTRKPNQIYWDELTEDAVLTLAREMTRKYSSQIPLVEPGEQRLRIARVAIALAMRFHSTDDGENVVVKMPHVELAEWFFYQCYDRPAFAYDAYSRNRMRTEELSDKDYESIKHFIEAFPNASALLHTIASVENMDRLPLVHWQDNSKFLSSCVTLGIGEPTNKGILKTKKFSTFYHQWLTANTKEAANAAQ